MGIRQKPKVLVKRFRDIGEDPAKTPLGSIVAFTILGLFITIPFLFLLYPAWIAYEYLVAEKWHDLLVVVVTVFSLALVYLIIWLSSMIRTLYLLTLTGSLSFLALQGTLTTLGPIFAILSCAAIAIVGATVILLTYGLRE